jgi:hypothetical protein
MYAALLLHKLNVSYKKVSETTPLIINGKEYRCDGDSFLLIANFFANDAKEGIRQFKIKTDEEINGMIREIEQLWNDEKK